MATAVLLVACSSATQGPLVSTARTATPVDCSAAQSAPQLPQSSPSSRNLEIVWFKGSPKFLVRDITNIQDPSTLSKFDDLFHAQFVSSDAISYISGSELVLVPISGRPKTVVARCVGTPAFAWNAGGTKAAYITISRDTSAGELHLVSGGHNRLASLLPPMGITGCESQSCAEDFDFRLTYSPDDAYVAFVQNMGGSNLRIWSSDGQLLKTIDSADVDTKSRPSMSVWSGRSLYWSDGQGVEMWREGAQSLVLSGVRWIRPKASPGGSQIVYGARDASGRSHIYLLDTRSNVSRELTKSRSEAWFLNSHLIWYREERQCIASDQCSPGTTMTPSGKTYIYDLDDKTETESVVAAVFDVWPHAA